MVYTVKLNLGGKLKNYGHFLNVDTAVDYAHKVYGSVAKLEDEDDFVSTIYDEFEKRMENDNEY